MRSPFLSEREAFRFLLLVIVAMAAVVLAAVLGPTWLALGVLGLIVVVMAIRITQLRMRHSMEVPLESAPPHVGSASERRVLVVANDTLGDQGLLGGIAMVASAPGTTVLILAPALVSPGDRVTGAVDVPLAEARTRLSAALERIANDLDVKGEVSEADPIEAIEDSFATFAADEVIVCTRPERTRNGLEPLLAGLARERFAVPVRHLVFEPGSNPQESDREAESKYRREASSRKDKQVMLETVAVVGVLAALVLSMVALIRSNQPRAVAASGTASATSFLSNPVIAETSIVPEYKVGPDGKKHDAFTNTNFAVKAGQPLEIRVDNTDEQPHSITAPEAGVNITAMPGVHTYTVVVQKPGTYQWFCVYPCDSGANGWAMKHAGYMSGYITVS